MNSSWTRIHIQTSFYMVHIENLQWYARNLVRIGLHDSLTDEYATRLTKSTPRPLPDLGRLSGRVGPTPRRPMRLERA